MGLIKWMDKQTKNFTIWDFSVLKTYAFLIGMVLGAYVAGFVQQYVWYFVAVIIILMIRLLYLMFKK